MSATISFVTGTDTAVGKTIVSAVLCADALKRGLRTRYVKPVQTGVGPDGAGADAAEVHRLVGRFAMDAPIAPLGEVGIIDPLPSAFTAHELVRYAQPVAPAIAAAESAQPVQLDELVRSIRTLADTCEILIVEGAGGLLVPLSPQDTMADLASAIGATLVIVARPGLGTLNHTMLTLEAAHARKLSVERVVLTPWPETPGDLEENNLRWLRGHTLTHVVTLPTVSLG